MSTNQKEINNYLFDQLSIVERFEEALNIGENEARAEIERQKKEINRKLYQKLPLVSE